MSTRKIMLLSACGILLLVCIFQAVFANKDKSKIFKFTEDIDEICITGPIESFNLVLKGDTWYVGEKQYEASKTYVDSMIDALKEIKTLDKVANSNSEANLNRYELVNGKELIAIAKKNGKVLRTVEIGKNSSAGRQSYICIDGGKDIYLASGNIRGNLEKTVKELRSRTVYSIEKNDISAVSLKTPDSDFTVSKFGEGENLSWSISVPGITLDFEKAKDWLNSFASLTTPVWHDELDFTGTKIAECSVVTREKTLSFEIYLADTKTEDDNDVYYGTSNVSPYAFELASYSVKKFQKKVEDLQ